MASVEGVVKDATAWQEYLPDALHGFVDLVVPDQDGDEDPSSASCEKPSDWKDDR
jgi:hypothetical protein